VLADPYGSVFHTFIKEGILVKPKKFLVEGVGKETIPGAMDLSLIDECI
jgi:cysteine synthase